MYFPKNKIKTNLYSSGREFVYEDTLEPFSGFYYSLYNGTFFEGKSPTKNNKKIISSAKAFPSIDNKPFNITDIETSTAYIIPTGQTQMLPTFYYPQPTEKDYQIGQFLRYFCRKTNENVFLEINKTDYDSLFNKDPKYVYSLYQPFYLYWYISGKTREEASTINKKVALRYERLLKLYGLDRFIESIGGYDKFYK